MLCGALGEDPLHLLLLALIVRPTLLDFGYDLVVVVVVAWSATPLLLGLGGGHRLSPSGGDTEVANRRLGPGEESL